MWFKKRRASKWGGGIRVVGNLSASVCRTAQNAALREFCTPLSARRVLNIGARPNGPDKEGSKYEDYFPNAEFFTLDQRALDHPNHITADLLSLPTPEEKFDLIVMMSVLEHVRNPFLAAQELKKPRWTPKTGH